MLFTRQADYQNGSNCDSTYPIKHISESLVVNSKDQYDGEKYPNHFNVSFVGVNTVAHLVRFATIFEI